MPVKARYSVPYRGEFPPIALPVFAMEPVAAFCIPWKRGLRTLIIIFKQYDG